MNHLDLFSGIGGFSLAGEWVWGEEHNILAFVEKEKYCQKVLNKHWPDVPIFDDIKEFRYGDVSNAFEFSPRSYTERKGRGQEWKPSKEGAEGLQQTNGEARPDEPIAACGIVAGKDKEYGQQTIDLLTGGFPCQPFSVAGKQRGKADDRYLWPEMLRVIQEAKPTWLIIENVAGIEGMAESTPLPDLENKANFGLEEGMVVTTEGTGYVREILEEIETCGYETQPFIIPACGVGAPHQRYRIWLVAWNTNCGGRLKGKIKEVQRRKDSESSRVRTNVSDTNETGQRKRWRAKSIQTEFSTSECSSETMANTKGAKCKCTSNPRTGREGPTDRNSNEHEGAWPVEPDVGRVAHGISNRVDRLKGLGNAIVPQVVVPIMQAIREIESNNT